MACAVFGLATAAALACARSPAGEPEAVSVRLAFVGDTHGYNIAVNPALEGRDLLTGVREVLDRADVFVANHEGVLIEPEDAPAHCRTFERQSTFASPPDFATRLAVSPHSVATLANNHAMDCGPEGLRQTREAFAEANILTVGAGSFREEACRPAEVTAKGVHIVLLSYLLWDPSLGVEQAVATEEGSGVATIESCDAEAVIASLSEQDVVAVSLHAHVGPSWSHITAPEHLSAVRQLLEWGADVVVSHGPHFPQGVLVEEGGLAFLSLGNFMFRPDYTLPSEARRSFLALVELSMSDGQVQRALLYPLEITGEGLPVWARGSVAQEILELIGRLSAEYGVELDVQDGFGVVEFPVVLEQMGLP